MASWRQYGGRTQHDTNNFLYAASISCQDLTILRAYKGTLDIQGALTVAGDVNVQGNVSCTDKLLFDSFQVSGNGKVAGTFEVINNLIVDNRLDLGSSFNGNGSVANLYAVAGSQPFLYWDLKGGMLYVSGSLHMGSTRNILCENDLSSGIQVFVDDSTQRLQFLSHIPNENQLTPLSNGGGGIINPPEEATINAQFSLHLQNSGNMLECDVSGGFMYVSAPLVVGDLSATTLYQEQLTLYDSSLNKQSFLPSVYSQNLSFGTSLTAMHSSGHGVTMMQLRQGPDCSFGLTLAGGLYPNDTTRSLGLIAAGSEENPSLSLLSGSNPVYNTSSVGINTFAPTTEDYVLDINGPVLMHHGEIKKTFVSPFPITATSRQGDFVVSIGDPIPIYLPSSIIVDKYIHYALVSTDGLVTWNQYAIDDGFLNTQYALQAVYVMPKRDMDTHPIVFVGGYSGTMYFSKDGGKNWRPLNNGIFLITSSSILSLYSIFYDTYIRLYVTYLEQASSRDEVPSVSYYNINIDDGLYIGTNTHSVYDTTVINNVQVCGSPDNTYIYLLGNKNNSATLFQIYDTDLHSDICFNIPSSFTNLQVVNNNDFTGLVMVGYQYLYYIPSYHPTSDNSWEKQIFDGNVVLSNSFVYDASFSVLVGNYSDDQAVSNGFLAYSVTGLSGEYVSDTILVSAKLNQKGNAYQLLQYPLNYVWITDKHTLEIQGKTFTNPNPTPNQYFVNFLPELYDITDISNNVLDIYGRATVHGRMDIDSLHVSDCVVGTLTFINGEILMQGDISMNGQVGIRVLTTSFSQNLYGSASLGNMAIGGNTVLSGTLSCASDVSIFGNMYQQGNVSIQENLVVHGNIQSQGNLVVSGNLSSNSASVDSLTISGEIVPPFLYNPTLETISIGNQAGGSSNNDYAINVGFQAGQNNQSQRCISIGPLSGKDNQGENSLAIGNNAGSNHQSTESIALGNFSGHQQQGRNSIAIGSYSGNTSQGEDNVAIGTNAGQINQQTQSIAIGSSAGIYNQSSGCVAIGYSSGKNFQGTGALAIGSSSGILNQGNGTIAMGLNSGQYNQGDYSLALGTMAGQSSQGITSIAFGNNAGSISQGDSAIAIGSLAGTVTQGRSAIALGNRAGQSSQGNYAIAIGNNCSLRNQGNYSIAIGNIAEDQSANSIGFNATPSSLPIPHSGFFVHPIQDLPQQPYGLFYNPTTKEITYHAGLPSACVFGGISPAKIKIDLSQNYFNDVSFGQINESMSNHYYSSNLFDISLPPGVYMATVSVSLLFSVTDISFDSTALCISSSTDISDNISFLHVQPCTAYSSEINGTLTQSMQSLINNTNFTNLYVLFSLYNKTNPTTVINSGMPFATASYSSTFLRLV